MVAVPWAADEGARCRDVSAGCAGVGWRDGAGEAGQRAVRSARRTLTNQSSWPGLVPATRSGSDPTTDGRHKAGHDDDGRCLAVLVGDHS
jgi:hypothetical protein